MATWTDIASTEVDQDSPVTSSLMIALRDNPQAIAEGASGAPRVEDDALDTTATTAGTSWVLNRLALLTVRSVGTYIVAYNASSSDISAGSTIAGSNLRYSSGTANIFNYTSTLGGLTTLTGTWRAVISSSGYDYDEAYKYYPSFFIRIA